MRVLRPADNVIAFYDGRVEGYRYTPERNWVDEGGLALGIASRRAALTGRCELFVRPRH
jgi:cyclase